MMVIEGGPKNNYDSFKVASNFFLRLRKEGVDMDDALEDRLDMGPEKSLLMAQDKRKSSIAKQNGTGAHEEIKNGFDSPLRGGF